VAATTCAEVSAGEPARAPPAPRVLPDLATLDDQELLGIARSLPSASPRRDAARELLVRRHRRLVWLCVQRYRRGPEPAEDLMQVGYVGLLKAINNFDPAFGRTLATYAEPCITGEIKRHFRDKRWQVHVHRSLKELVLQTRQATLQLTQELGRTPADSDLARHLGVSTADIRGARMAELALQPSSLDVRASGALSLADQLGTEDRQLEHMLDLQAVATHWGELPSREQKILLLRFGRDMAQAQIAAQLGISQMHVSRLLAHALGHLRSRLLGLETSASGPPRPARQPGKNARTSGQSTTGPAATPEPQPARTHITRARRNDRAGAATA
jgi:RNA polymerase sigma-B factor